MRAWFPTRRACPILSPSAPFYRPREDTGLHGVRANIDYGMDEDTGPTEASVPAWLDGSCNSVLGNDGACVFLCEVMYNI